MKSARMWLRKLFLWLICVSPILILIWWLDNSPHQRCPDFSHCHEEIFIISRFLFLCLEKSFIKYSSIFWKVLPSWPAPYMIQRHLFSQKNLWSYILILVQNRKKHWLFEKSSMGRLLIMKNLVVFCSRCSLISKY
jgi:hypothetical protein